MQNLMLTKGITGRIIRRNGLPLSGAEIIVKGNISIIDSARTDKDGYYSINLEAGRYDIAARLHNYRPIIYTNVITLPSRSTILNFIADDDTNNTEAHLITYKIPLIEPTVPGIVYDTMGLYTFTTGRFISEPVITTGTPMVDTTNHHIQNKPSKNQKKK